MDGCINYPPSDAFVPLMPTFRAGDHLLIYFVGHGRLPGSQADSSGALSIDGELFPMDYPKKSASEALA